MAVTGCKPFNAECFVAHKRKSARAFRCRRQRTIDSVHMSTPLSVCRHFGQFVRWFAGETTLKTLGLAVRAVWKPSCSHPNVAQRSRSLTSLTKRAMGKDGLLVANRKARKCAHAPCLCDARPGEVLLKCVSKRPLDVSPYDTGVSETQGGGLQRLVGAGIWI